MYMQAPPQKKMQIVRQNLGWRAFICFDDVDGY